MQLSNSTVFWPLLYFNNPKKGKYAIGWLVKTIILEKIGAITTALEKSFTSRKSLKNFYQQEVWNLQIGWILYTEYRKQTLELVKESQASKGDPNYVHIVKYLPALESDVSKKYPTNELLFTELILEKLDSLDHFHHLHIDSLLPTKCHCWYPILQNLEQNGLPLTKTVFFCQKFGNNLGNTYFILKEVGSIKTNATERNKVIQSLHLNLRSSSPFS